MCLRVLQIFLVHVELSISVCHRLEDSLLKNYIALAAHHCPFSRLWSGTGLFCAILLLFVCAQKINQVCGPRLSLSTCRSEEKQICTPHRFRFFSRCQMSTDPHKQQIFGDCGGVRVLLEMCEPNQNTEARLLVPVLWGLRNCLHSNVSNKDRFLRAGGLETLVKAGISFSRPTSYVVVLAGLTAANPCVGHSVSNRLLSRGFNSYYMFLCSFFIAAGSLAVIHTVRQISGRSRQRLISVVAPTYDSTR